MTKYYLKEKCQPDCSIWTDGSPKHCFKCNGEGFIRGADVTELVLHMFKLIDVIKIDDVTKIHIKYNVHVDLIEVVK